MGGDVAIVSAAAAMHINSTRFSSLQAGFRDTYPLSSFSFLPLAFPQSFAFLCEDLPISATEQLVYF
jgi:hypothetical protein